MGNVEVSGGGPRPLALRHRACMCVTPIPIFLLICNITGYCCKDAPRSQRWGVKLVLLVNNSFFFLHCFSSDVHSGHMVVDIDWDPCYAI